MAKGVKTTVTVNGRVETRTSESRTYTHVLLVLKDGRKMKAHVESPYSGKDLAAKKKEWEGFQQYVGGQWVPSTVEPWTGPEWLMSVDRRERCHGGSRPLVVTAKSKAYYDDLAAGGFDAWLAKEHAARLEQFNKDVERGRFKWKVLGWSASERNALKRSEIKYYDQFKVVPVGAVVTLEGDYPEEPHHPDCPATDGFPCHCDELS